MQHVNPLNGRSYQFREVTIVGVGTYGPWEYSNIVDTYIWE